MRTKVTEAFPETALERILAALERELVEATDADILEAAGDLGMKPGMKGSAAFLGLRYYPSRLRPEDFFGMSAEQQELGQWVLEQLAGLRLGLLTRNLGEPRDETSRGKPARAQAPRSRAPRTSRPGKGSRNEN